jgi:anion-transporting  ArsA/GET3 family ATPase
MFTNPRETSVLVVTLPEELPVTETLELLGSVRKELELPLGALVVNGVMGNLFDERERAELAKIETMGEPATTAASAVQAAARRAVQEELQAASLARLFAATSLPRIVLPYLFEDAATPRAIEALSSHF